MLRLGTVIVTVGASVALLSYLTGAVARVRVPAPEGGMEAIRMGLEAVCQQGGTAYGLRWRRRPGDVPRAATLQRALLDAYGALQPLVAELGTRYQALSAAIRQREAKLQQFADVLQATVRALDPHLEFFPGITHIADHDAIHQQQHCAVDLQRV